MNKLLPLLLASLVFASFFSLFKPVFAAQGGQQSNSSITVSPALARIDLSTDPSELDISYTNNTSQALQLTFKSEDFTYVSDGWQVKFLDKTDAANYNYSLSTWMHFEVPDMILNPGETRQLKVTIDKDRLTPGSHFGAVIAQTKPANPEKLTLEVDISSLIFARSGTGAEVEEGVIDSIEPVRSYWQLPDRFVLRFRNSGNVDLTPYGLVDVLSPTGQKISEAVFNDGSSTTLPESIRRYDIIMPDFKNFQLPGEYTVHAVLHFGKSNKYIEKYNHFFSLGSITFTEIILAIILLASFIFAIRKFKRKKSK